MAISAVGYTGTVNQAQWAEIMGLSGLVYSCGQYGTSSDPLKVAAVAGSRAVSVQTGAALGYGVEVKSDTVITPLALATPAAGRWYKIVVHRDWVAKTGTIIALPWDTTTDVLPLVPPTTSAVGEVHNPGTGQDDQPLAAVWVSASSTTVTVWDLRSFTMPTVLARIAALERGLYADLDSLPAASNFPEGSRVHIDELNVDFDQVDGVWVQDGISRFATAAARDTAYAKGAAAYRVAGIQCVLNTAPLITMEHNGNQASPSAGWQNVGTIKPSAVSVISGTGTGTINDDGTVTVVTTAGTSNVILRDILPLPAVYGTDEAVISASWVGAGSAAIIRMATAGTIDPTNTNYDYYGIATNNAGTQSNAVAAGTGNWPVLDAISATEFEFAINLRHANDPARRTRGLIRNTALIAPGNERVIQGQISHRQTTQFDGFAILGLGVGTLVLKVTRP